MPDVASCATPAIEAPPQLGPHCGPPTDPHVGPQTGLTYGPWSPSYRTQATTEPDPELTVTVINT